MDTCWGAGKEQPGDLLTSHRETGDDLLAHWDDLLVHWGQLRWPDPICMTVAWDKLKTNPKKCVLAN